LVYGELKNRIEERPTVPHTKRLILALGYEKKIKEMKKVIEDQTQSNENKN